MTNDINENTAKCILDKDVSRHFFYSYVDLKKLNDLLVELLFITLEKIKDKVTDTMWPL